MGRHCKWIDSFLCYRQQRVVVNGAKSDWVPVLSGVPQGTVHGPLLFPLYINDISTDIDSEIRFFADDCVDANKKETDKKDPCFIYSRGNGPRKCRKHKVSWGHYHK